jgi:hypothetical protein
MHYAGGHMPRIDQTASDVQADREIAELTSKIQQGDNELSTYRERYPYRTFEVMDMAAGWNNRRYGYVKRLTELSQQQQRRAVDNEWRPTTGAYFVGSER